MREFLKNEIVQVSRNYKISLKYVLLIALTMLFFAVFDSVVAFSVPIAITDAGFSETEMGFIYASSSVFGILFDLILNKKLGNSHYRRTLLYALITALLFPISFFISESIILFILSMMLWSLYTNLWSFAYYDFAARESKIAFHTAGIALLFLFTDIGGLIGMIIVEPISNLSENSLKILILTTILSLSLFSLVLSRVYKRRSDTNSQIKSHIVPVVISKPSSLSINLNLIKKIWPIILLIITITTVEAVVWTVTPILDKTAPQLQHFTGIILAVTLIPSIFTSIILSRRKTLHGKKKAAIILSIVGSLLLMAMGLTNSVLPYIIFTLLYSTCFSVVSILIGGIFSDFLDDSKSYDTQILSLQDLGYNIAFVIGPILGTTLLHLTSSLKLFTILGGISVLVIGLIFIFIPKKIHMHDNQIEV